MTLKVRLVLFVTLTLAMLFGFMHFLFPQYNFERLHIFLFNLCAGGSTIVYYTENKEGVSLKNMLFYIFSFLYAFLAFFHFYKLAIVVSLILVLIVESVRVKRFSFFPYTFFTKEAKTTEKFHHASLLCMSLGLLLSTFAIYNHEFIRILPFKKFELNTFFLGFSFPVSLITLSVIFSTMEKSKDDLQRVLKISIFWIINLGVIVFFIFILFESAILELIISVILFLTVFMVLLLYLKIGKKLQQKAFLTSGICFLIVTAITGVAYILLYFYPEYYTAHNLKLLRNFHRIVSLYGWNLSGLIVIIRSKDFPLLLHSGKMITLHWITVFLLAPLGYYHPVFAALSLVSYLIFLYFALFSKCRNDVLSCQSGIV